MTPPCFLIIEILIKIGIGADKLLQIRPGPGTGIMDGKAGRRQAAPPRIACNDYPMLGAVCVRGPEQHRPALPQLFIDGA